MSRLYDTTEWKRLRKMVLADEPLCRRCTDFGLITAATVVDHIKRVEERPDLKLDRANLQPLCKTCHDGAKHSEDIRGYSRDIGADGWPVDKRHPFHR